MAVGVVESNLIDLVNGVAQQIFKPLSQSRQLKVIPFYGVIQIAFREFVKADAHYPSTVS